MDGIQIKALAKAPVQGGWEAKQNGLGQRGETH